MVDMELSDMIRRLIKREGGFVDDPLDRGGATKYGITQGTLAEWRNKPVSRNEVINLSLDEAIEIYTVNYFVKPRFDKIKDIVLRELVFDAAVNSGVKRATQWLQRAAGVLDDGIIGPMTLDAANGFNSKRMRASFQYQRQQFIDALLVHDPTQKRFAKGWQNRLDEMWNLV